MDHRLFKAINQYTGHFRIIDVLMIFISQKLRYVFAFVLLFLFLRDHYHRKAAIYSGISALITVIVTGFIKIFYFKPRPFAKKRVNLLAPFPSKKDSSFPSKHTTLAFAVSISILFYKRTIGVILTVFAFFAGFSRIWMGQHYPSDIIGSALIGTFISTCVKLITNVWDPVTRILHKNEP